MAVYDLLYMGQREDYDKVKSMIAKKFPDTKFEDNSDWLHPYRLVVNNENLDNTVWLGWVLVNGVGWASFDWQLTSMQKPEFAKALLKWLIAEKKRVKGETSNVS